MIIRSIEANKDQFLGSNQKSVTFINSYQKPPIVTASSMTENIKIYISSVTTEGFVAEKSDTSTSEFHWVAIEKY